MLDVDLNDVPPSESRDQDGTSNRTRSQDRQAAQGDATLPPPIDLEAFDDDVIISSPRAFAEVYHIIISFFLFSYYIFEFNCLSCVHWYSHVI